MTTQTIGIIMNGVTGRMGTNQHLARSILAIRDQGGLEVAPGEVIIPEPVLVGRNESKLEALAESHGVARYTTSLDECLDDPDLQIYFDAQITDRRVEAVRRAIDAGKHIYCEKPAAANLADALDLHHRAVAAGVKSGVVQDKLWLPGLQKLRHLIDEGFFGRIFAVRGEFGYWVFDGRDQPCQRPSWNYRKADGGGIIIDMLCHWRYVIDDLFGAVTGLSCIAATHIPSRIDEAGVEYKCTAEDAAYATLTCDSGVICHFNSSWCVRVRRDELLTIQVDGTDGSAVAGLRKCRIQPAAGTPRPVWNPDIDSAIDFYTDWEEVEPDAEYDNAFKVQWELFLRHIICDEPFRWDLLAGAKGIQLAECGLQSWQTRNWVDVEALADC